MSKMTRIGPRICLKVHCVQFDPKSPKGSVPNVQSKFLTRDAISGLSVKSFQLEEEVLDTSEPLFGSVRNQNIIVFILVLYANRVEGNFGHFRTLIRKCPTIQFPQIFPLFLSFGNKNK